MPLPPKLALGLLLALLAGPLLAGRPAPKPARPADLWGQVFDPDGPVAGARVRLQGTAVFTETDTHGRFRLPADPRARRLTAWRAGHLIAGTRPAAPPGPAARARRRPPRLRMGRPGAGRGEAAELRQLPRRDLPRVVGQRAQPLGRRAALPQPLRGHRLERRGGRRLGAGPRTPR